MTTETCLGPHTKYQIKNEEEWACPHCEAKAPIFVIIESQYHGCEKIHDEDEIECSNCWFSEDGKEVMKLLAKKSNAITCPMCHGKGNIQKEV